MVFTGSKESCPNYDSDINELNMSWDTYTSPFQGARSNIIDPSSGKAEYNKKCFNICPTLNDDLSDKGPTYIDNGLCRECSDEEGSLNNPAQGTRRNLKNSGRYEMCNVVLDPDSGSNNVSGSALWFQKQQDANLSGINVDGINWSRANDSGSEEGQRILNYWSGASVGLSDQDILRLIGNHTAGTMKYTLPEKYMKREYIGNVSQNDELGVEVFDFEKVRIDINEGRGNIINCPTGTDLPDWVSCQDGTFGPNDIVVEEVEDFIVEMLDNESSSTTTSTINNLSSFTSLLSGLQYDSTFEACVNDKLNTGVNDLDAQERVSKYTSIKEFKSEDINYLKQKLRKISIMKTDQVNECMNLLNLGKSLCQTGVADKTLMIGSLIFKIIGNDKIDIMKADNDEKYKINQLVDEIGPLIPRAVKNIIKVSKEYEARVCNVPSNTTLLLERLYTDLYDKQTNVTLDISPYIDFDSLIGEKDIFTFIKKITVLVVFAFLFMQATNLVVAFLSRGSSAKTIS